MFRFLVVFSFIATFISSSVAQDDPEKIAEQSQAIVYANADTKMNKLMGVMDLLRPQVDHLVAGSTEEEGIHVKIFADVDAATAEIVKDKLTEAGVDSVEIAPYELEWMEYSAEKFDGLNGEQGILTFFRADWCATGLLFEKRLKERPELMLKIRTMGLQLMKVDMTERGGEAEDFAREHRVNTVPVLLCFSKSRPDEGARIDESIFFKTEKKFIEVLQDAYRSGEDEDNDEDSGK